MEDERDQTVPKGNRDSRKHSKCVKMKQITFAVPMSTAKEHSGCFSADV